MKRSLTKTEKIYYDAIKAYVKENGVFPSGKDIRRLTGRASISPCTKALKSLVRKGWVRSIETPYNTDKRNYSVARAYVVIQDEAVCVDNRGRSVPTGTLLMSDLDDRPLGFWIPGEIFHEPS